MPFDPQGGAGPTRCRFVVGVCLDDFRGELCFELCVCAAPGCVFLCFLPVCTAPIVSVTIRRGLFDWGLMRHLLPFTGGCC